jgi:hypothetical protein
MSDQEFNEEDMESQQKDVRGLASQSGGFNIEFPPVNHSPPPPGSGRDGRRGEEAGQEVPEVGFPMVSRDMFGLNEVLDQLMEAACNEARRGEAPGPATLVLAEVAALERREIELARRRPAVEVGFPVRSDTVYRTRHPAPLAPAELASLERRPLGDAERERFPTCSVCLDPFLAGGEVVLAGCAASHPFHGPCLEGWAARSGACLVRLSD